MSNITVGCNFEVQSFLVSNAGHLLFKINVNSSVHRCFKFTFYYDLHVSVMIMFNKNCTMHKALINWERKLVLTVLKKCSIQWW